MIPQTIEREKLYKAIEALPDVDIGKLAMFVEFLRYSGERHIPNAETIEAIEELRAGKGEKVTIDQIMAELNAGN